MIYQSREVTAFPINYAFFIIGTFYETLSRVFKNEMIYYVIAVDNLLDIILDSAKLLML